MITMIIYQPERRENVRYKKIEKRKCILEDLISMSTLLQVILFGS
jgi:hypothetical protein